MLTISLLLAIDVGILREVLHLRLLERCQVEDVVVFKRHVIVYHVVLSQLKGGTVLVLNGFVKGLV